MGDVFTRSNMRHGHGLYGSVGYNYETVKMFSRRRTRTGRESYRYTFAVTQSSKTRFFEGDNKVARENVWTISHKMWPDHCTNSKNLRKAFFDTLDLPPAEPGKWTEEGNRYVPVIALLTVTQTKEDFDRYWSATPGVRPDIYEWLGFPCDYKKCSQDHKLEQFVAMGVHCPTFRQKPYEYQWLIENLEDSITRLTTALAAAEGSKFEEIFQQTLKSNQSDLEYISRLLQFYTANKHAIAFCDGKYAMRKIWKTRLNYKPNSLLGKNRAVRKTPLARSLKRYIRSKIGKDPASQLADAMQALWLPRDLSLSLHCK